MINTFNFRITEKNLSIVKDKAAKSNMSLSAYFQKCVAEKNIVVKKKKQNKSRNVDITLKKEYLNKIKEKAKELNISATAYVTACALAENNTGIVEV